MSEGLADDRKAVEWFQAVFELALIELPYPHVDPVPWPAGGEQTAHLPPIRIWSRLDNRSDLDRGHGLPVDPRPTLAGRLAAGRASWGGGA